MMIVNPVIVRPLREEWTDAKRKIEKLVQDAHLKAGQSFRNAIAKAEEARSQFLERLRNLTINEVNSFEVLLATNHPEHQSNFEDQARKSCAHDGAGDRCHRSH
jgi:hypothetical protein